MARLQLGKTETVNDSFKMPSELKEAFGARCASLEMTKSEVVRMLIERWLRQTRHIERLKLKEVR